MCPVQLTVATGCWGGHAGRRCGHGAKVGSIAGGIAAAIRATQFFAGGHAMRLEDLNLQVLSSNLEQLKP